MRLKEWTKDMQRKPAINDISKEIIKKKYNRWNSYNQYFEEIQLQKFKQPNTEIWITKGLALST